MKDRLTNNIGLKLTAVLFATLLWIVVVSIDDPVDEMTFRGIPVNVINEEIYTTQGSTYHIMEGNETVNVVVRAKRSVIKEIHSSEIKVTADMKYRASNPYNEVTVPTSVKIQGFEEKDYKAATTPQSILIQVEAHASNKFPINVATIGTPRDGYVLGKVTPNPAYVNIQGGESQVNRIKKVIAKADVSGISQNGSVEAELILYDSNDKIIDQALLGNNLGDEGLKVNVEVLRTKIVPLKFETSAIKTAPGYVMASVGYEPKSLVVAGTSEELKELSEVVIPSGALVYTNLKQSQIVDVDVKDYLPEGIRLADETLSKVVVTIQVEKSGTKTITIPVGSIKLENVLTKFKPSFATMDDVELQIQGSQAALKLAENDLEAYIDMEQYTVPGTYIIPVKVNLPVGCSLTRNVTVQIILEEK